MTQSVLTIAAHPDDEVLGAGGTLSKHVNSGDEVHILIVTEGSTAQYDDKSLITAKKEAATSCAEILGVEGVHFGELTDMKLDATPHVDVNAVIEQIVADIDPDIVYTHSPHEVNKDHIVVYESTMVATRPESGVSKVYTYETPSSTEWVGGDEDHFEPVRYVDITGHLNQKIKAFHEYESEVRDYPHPRSKESLEARAKTRGVEAGFKAAEAFGIAAQRIQEL